MKKAYTPTQSLDQVFILSKLVEKPMRYSELWQGTRSCIKSKETLGHSLRSLEKERIVERNEKGRREVTYRVAKDLDKEALEVLSLARGLSEWGSFELIADSMEFLIDNTHFSSKEEALEAAIGFWVERYRNLCVLNALSSLARNDSDGEDSVLNLRKLYQTCEDRLFDLLKRFKGRHSPLFDTILEKKLFFMGIDLRPGWVNMKLDQFLETYYPEPYKRLSDVDKANNYFRLLEREREKGYFKCRKHRKEFPRWVCRFCKSRNIPSAKKYRPVRTCKYQEVQTLRDRLQIANQAELVH